MASCSGCKRKDPIGVEPKPTDPMFHGKSIAIAGYSVRAINLSAKTCGLKTHSIDCFADMDLRRLADEFIFINLDQYKNETGRLDKPTIEIVSEEMMQNEDKIKICDYFILGSMFENYPEILLNLEKYPNYVGSSAESVKKVRNSELLFNFLVSNHILFPKTIVLEINDSLTPIRYIIYNSTNFEPNSPEWTQMNGSLSEFFDTIISQKLKLPIVLKSEKSGGGFGVNLVKSKQEFIDSIKYLESLGKGRIIIQEYINGVNMSCSFISNGTQGRIISFSKQIIGEKRFGSNNPFNYCGNIMNEQLSNPENNHFKLLKTQMKDIVNKLVKHSSLRGSNGIDFIVSGDLNSNDFKIYLIEVNARFQGTIDLFEALTGHNVVEMHLKSILKKELPEKIDYPDPDTYQKTIYYSPLEFHIMVDLQNFDFRDVPLIGNFISDGQPLCSTLTKGKTEEEAFEHALDDRDLIIQINRFHTRIDPKSPFLLR